MDYLIIFTRSIFFYLFIFIIYKIMGKREIGQLGIIDLIVSILVAELAVISIEEFDNNMLYSIIPILTLTIMQIVLSYISLKLPDFRLFLEGTPSLIIKNGRVNFKEMIKQKYNLDELLTQLREKGYKSIEEVDYAILESNGTLSAFAKNNNNSYIPLPIILDSKIQEDTLKHLKKDKEWVYKLLKLRNIDITEVFYAFYKDKNIFIIKNSDLI